MFFPDSFKNTSDKPVKSYLEALEAFRDEHNRPLGFNVALAKSFADIPGVGPVEVADRKHVYRTDSNGVVGTVGNRFEPIQSNMPQLVQTMQAIEKALGLEYYNGGTFGGGSRMYLQARMGEPMRLKKNNGGEVTNGEVSRDFTLLNANDGSLLLQIDGTNTTIVCANTFAMASREAVQGLLCKHTSKCIEDSFRDPLAVAAGMVAYQEQAEQRIVKLVQTDFTDTMLDSVLRKVSGIKADLPESDVPTRTVNTWDNIRNKWQSGTGIDETNRGTAWAALNAFTEHLTHEAGVRVATPKGLSDGQVEAWRAGAEDLARFESNLVGSASNMKNKALRAIEAVIDETA